MSVPKKAKPIDAAAMISGAAHIEAVRGITNWGANYVFNSGALQGDILSTADAVSQIGTRTEALAGPSGGIYMKSADSSTGVYHVFYSSSEPVASSASGYLHIVPV